MWCFGSFYKVKCQFLSSEIFTVNFQQNKQNAFLVRLKPQSYAQLLPRGLIHQICSQHISWLVVDFLFVILTNLPERSRCRGDRVKEALIWWSGILPRLMKWQGQRGLSVFRFLPHMPIAAAMEPNYCWTDALLQVFCSQTVTETACCSRKEMGLNSDNLDLNLGFFLL